jgi:hypothetical protein
MTMIPDITRDPPHDAELAAAMAGIDRAAAADPSELDRLREAILARAELPLARLRLRPRAWWQVAAGWAGAAVPLSAAAGVALVLVVGSLPIPGPPTAAATEGLPYLEEVLAVSLPEAGEALFVETFGAVEP